MRPRCPGGCGWDSRAPAQSCVLVELTRWDPLRLGIRFLLAGIKLRL
jgi:hypothetical protein